MTNWNLNEDNAGLILETFQGQKFLVDTVYRLQNTCLQLLKERFENGYYFTIPPRYSLVDLNNECMQKLPKPITNYIINHNTEVEKQKQSFELATNWINQADQCLQDANSMLAVNLVFSAEAPFSACRDCGDWDVRLTQLAIIEGEGLGE